MPSARSKDTEPERRVRSAAHALGYRFRLYRRDLPGSPDLVFPKHHKVVFVHGCFWHQHEDPGCKNALKPKTNTSYWLPKLERNRARDTRAVEKLASLGWQSLVVWECQTNDRAALTSMLRRFFESKEN